MLEMDGSMEPQLPPATEPEAVEQFAEIAQLSGLELRHALLTTGPIETETPYEAALRAEYGIRVYSLLATKGPERRRRIRFQVLGGATDNLSEDQIHFLADEFRELAAKGIVQRRNKYEYAIGPNRPGEIRTLEPHQLTPIVRAKPEVLPKSPQPPLAKFGPTHRDNLEEMLRSMKFGKPKKQGYSNSVEHFARRYARKGH